MPLLTGSLTRLAAANVDTDLDTWAAWAHNSEFLRFVDGDPAQPWSRQQARKDLEELPKDNQFLFVIRTLADNRLVGFVGLFGVQWTHGDAWVGIGLGDEKDWGKGYGTDAMRVVLHYAFTELNLHRASLIVLSYNPRAIRSYEKAGFTLEGRTRQTVQRAGQYWDDVYMGILRDEWESKIQDSNSKIRI